MSRAEKFILENINNGSSDIIGWKKNGLPIYKSWITPDQALRAVEIAREEMIKRAYSFISGNLSEYIELKHANPAAFIKIDGDRFANDLKQAMKDE